jgi:hypothetical protein
MSSLNNETKEAKEILDLKMKLLPVAHLCKDDLDDATTKFDNRREELIKQKNNEARNQILEEN